MIRGNLFAVGCLALIGMALVALSGCAPAIKPEELHKAWVITDVEIERAQTNAFSPRDTKATEGGFFRFFPDGSAVVVRAGRYRVGTWTWDKAEKAITLAVPGRDPLRLGVAKLVDGGLQFTVTEDSQTVTYTVEADEFNYGERDIYSTTMNSWRVPTNDPQSDAELSARLVVMLRYLEALFEAAALREIETLDLAHVPTPFVFASNGVALHPQERIPAKWSTLFASRDESFYAAHLLGTLFRHVTVPTVTNRFERNASIFGQMAAALEAKITIAKGEEAGATN